MNMWLVGAGYWGSKMLDNLQKFGVTPRNSDIKNGQSIQQIDDQSPVMLATPLWEHYDQCRYLLKNGHDVYVEKPMAETVDQIRELKSLLRPGQIFMVGHIFQHHPQRHEIKTMIETGFIGDVTHVTSRRLNWGIYQTKTDPVLSLGTHDISIVLDITKQSAVVDHSACFYTTHGIQPDRVIWSGRCGDITFDCDVSWAWPTRVRETVIIGTQGQIVWDQDRDTYTVSKHRVENNRCLLDNDSQTINYTSALSPLEHEIQHWIECVRDRRSPSTGIDQALAVAQVIEQINRGQSNSP